MDQRKVVLSMYHLLYKNKGFDVLGRRNKELKEYTLIPNEGKEKLFASAQKANKFLQDNGRFFSVIDAFEDIEKLNKNFTGVDRRWQFYISRKVRSYFLEVDIYLKHLERYTGKLGKGDKFKKITSKAYDENKYYAMAYILRNYISHAQDAIHEMQWDHSGYKLWVYQSKLLNDIKISNSGRQIINEFSEKIDLFEIIYSSYESLMQVHESILNLLLSVEIKDALLFLNEIYDNNEFANNSSFYICRSDSPLPINPQEKLDFAVQNLYWDDYLAMKKFLL